MNIYGIFWIFFRFQKAFSKTKLRCRNLIEKEAKCKCMYVWRNRGRTEYLKTGVTRPHREKEIIYNEVKAANHYGLVAKMRSH